jgi:hypothetical protein
LELAQHVGVEQELAGRFAACPNFHATAKSSFSGLELWTQYDSELLFRSL